jgi:phosphoesterase RecJ-like protein
MLTKLRLAGRWKAAKLYRSVSRIMKAVNTATPELIASFMASAQHIVVMQADNPDGDSLGSSLALEAILGEMGKQVTLYCGVIVPTYLRYLAGWDRVVNELPHQFDAVIIVDTSADSLFETLNKSPERSLLNSKPCLVIDHHPSEVSIPYATLVYNQLSVATGQIIYELADELKWPLPIEACKMLATSILSDSLGLMSEGTSSRSIHIIGELVDRGVKLAELENRRRETMRKSPGIVAYKGALLQRVQYSDDGRVAYITIPWEEIEKHSHEYNPSVLVLDEMRLVHGVDVAISFKEYPDGKLTGKIRCNYGKTIATELAQHFGGGGHPYASGFKVTDGRPYNEVKLDCLAYAAELLDTLEEKTNETV